MVTLEVTKKRSPKNSLPLGLLSGERGTRTLFKYCKNFTKTGKNIP